MATGVESQQKAQIVDHRLEDARLDAALRLLIDRVVRREIMGIIRRE